MEDAFRPGTAVLAGRDWIADASAAPDLATAFGLDLRTQARTRSGEPARGRLVVVPPAVPRSITLAVMARPDDERWRTLAERYRPFFGEVLVILDADRAPTAESGGARVLAHPLEGDFGAQRNRLQSALRSRWALHLDTDETLTPRALLSLRAATRNADRRGVAAMALPRVNLVEARTSDMFPDVQYRLVRSDQRFENRVHERVETCRNEKRTAVLRTGAIVHHLDRAHVLARTKLYDRLGQSADRHDDEVALLRRYRGRPPAGWRRLPPS